MPLLQGQMMLSEHHKVVHKQNIHDNMVELLYCNMLVLDRQLSMFVYLLLDLTLSGQHEAPH